jgi:hypothetical protein
MESGGSCASVRLPLALELLVIRRLPDLQALDLQLALCAAAQQCSQQRCDEC